MKLTDLTEARENRFDMRWLDKTEQNIIRSVSAKLKQMVEATNWLRMGYEDSENGEHFYGYHLRKSEGNGPRAFRISLLGKWIPNALQHMDISQLADGPAAKELAAKMRKRTKEPTAEEIEKIQNKSLRMMQGFIGTIAKTDFGKWTDEEGITKTMILDHVETRILGGYHNLSPETAAAKLAEIYPREKQHIEYFGRELYAPHVQLYFKFKAIE
jgi:hypothetical protein